MPLAEVPEAFIYHNGGPEAISEDKGVQIPPPKKKIQNCKTKQRVNELVR